jgi:ABC-2 type transport system ATP-binding protein
MSILTVEKLNKSYKKGFIPKTQKVLHDVSFSLQPRTITGFLGGNGAGKTTTIKCILELAYPDSGSVTFFDGKPIDESVKRRIGFLPERPYFYEYLTGVEFLQFYGQLSTSLKRKDLNDRIDHLLKRVDLLHAKNKKLREYSKGMLQKIGVAQALIHDPEFVILDEPMSGLDPDGRFYLAELIRETAREGRSVFFSSHLLPDAEALCEQLVILKEGRVSYQGSLDTFLQKMGEAAIITYMASGQKQTIHVETEKDLQDELQKLIRQGAAIEAVKKDRNLEQAFIKLGLHGDGT